MKHRRLPLCVAALAVLGATQGLSACTDAAPAAGPSPSADAGTEASVAKDAASPVDDASRPDTPAPDGGPLDLSCLGQEASMFVDEGLPFAYVRVDGQLGEFLVDFATTASTIDMGAFTTAPTAKGCDASKLGQRCTFDAFEFFGPRGPLALFTDQHGRKQAGILATDVLAKGTVTLKYKAQKIYWADAPCAAAALTQAGFSRMDSKGFYGQANTDLKPLTDVIADADPNRLVPNVPTVKASVGGVSVLTQLDTGFADDAVAYSVNVNEALLAAMPAGTLVRNATKDLSLSTCVGISEAVEAYELASGKTFELGGKSFPKASIFVKRTPKAAKACGGIGTWTVPAAQVGLSFFVALDTLVFDPSRGEVWVGPQ